MSRATVMTWRARAFLAVLAFRHLSIGALALLATPWFDSPAYRIIDRVLPLELWGALMLVTGAAAAGAAYTGSETWARGVLITSAAITGAWSAGFACAAWLGYLDAPPLPLTWAALTAKDLIVSAMPLRTPLEDAMRRTTGEQPSDSG